jgi:hypothetical protein
MREPKVDKNALFISFYKGDTLIREYIPAPVSKYESKARIKYRILQDKLNVPNYYWHFRHLLDPDNRKIEDLKFLIHVYEEHGSTPVDDYEKKYYSRVFNLYSAEFNTLIKPKLALNSIGKGANHPYANAYYKKWLREKNGNLTRLYHGVDIFEMEDMYYELLNNFDAEMNKLVATDKYYNNKAKEYKKLNPRSKSFKAERKKFNLKRKFKYEKFKQDLIIVDILLSILIITSHLAANFSKESIYSNIFIILFYLALLQIPLFFIYQFVKDNYFGNLDE